MFSPLLSPLKFSSYAPMNGISEDRSPESSNFGVIDFLFVLLSCKMSSGKRTRRKREFVQMMRRYNEFLGSFFLRGIITEYVTASENDVI